jgi:hypothetical protein
VTARSANCLQVSAPVPQDQSVRFALIRRHDVLHSKKGLVSVGTKYGAESEGESPSSLVSSTARPLFQ